MFGSYFLAKMTKANTNRKSGSDRNGPIVEDRSSDYFWWLERNRPVTMKPEGPCTCKYLPVQRLHCNSLREKIPFDRWRRKNENKSAPFIGLFSGIFWKIIKKVSFIR
jgi:hypothetical protein